MDLLIFDLDTDAFGVPVDIVRSVLPAVRVTRLPGAPDVVEGVVDVRGTPTPVFDPRRRFGLPPRPVAAEQHLVHADAGGRPVLLRVDRVREVIAVDEADVAAGEELVHGGSAVAGVARVRDGLVLIHDLERFLSQAEAIQLEAALAERPASGGAGVE